MTEIDHIDVCVIGAGVVGLAVARELAQAGFEVLVLEKEHRFGEGVSSRNSEVIHAGIYYPQGSLKATLCVRGKKLLYDYSAERNVRHQRIGKLIVATNDSEMSQLSAIQEQAAANGVNDLEQLNADQIRLMEPSVFAVGALLSPSTGIINAADLMTSFLGDMEANGGSLACHANVSRIHSREAGFLINCDIEGSPYQFSCRYLVNSAGLGAQSVAASIEGFDRSLIPRLHLCKGNYFLLSGRNPFNHLIYPVPDPGGAGLGVHATIDVGGQVKFGPDVEYVSEENYRVSDQRLLEGYEAIRRYFPALEEGMLAPGYAGIRPKLQGPGEPARDFEIQDRHTHNLAGLINLFGIESPGLTSSMAIAETVRARIETAG
jgi:L-2-hydroxyglutarate oxidase LhgO